MEEGGDNSPVRAAPAYSMTAPGILDLARKGDGHSMRVALQRDCSSVVINEQDKVCAGRDRSICVSLGM